MNNIKIEQLFILCLAEIGIKKGQKGRKEKKIGRLGIEKYNKRNTGNRYSEKTTEGQTHAHTEKEVERKKKKGGRGGKCE